MNGCVDLLTQELSYVEFAYNNTYGLQTINETVYNQAVHDWSRPGGCKDLILHCRALASQGDPNFYGNNDTVNEACMTADAFCSNNVDGVYPEFSGRSYYDIAHLNPDPFPPEFFLGFLAQNWVQGALGVPINYTESVNSVFYAFSSVGDSPRSDVRGYLNDIGYLLDSGVKVALVYGDRDYACQWLGGEEVSLAVPYSQSSAFKSAGYTDLQTNPNLIGGQVRQHGNFSFTRVYESGHEVPAYQPETAYEIFYRSLFNLDIATGTVKTSNKPDYHTNGTSNTFHIKNKVPESPQPTCYVRSLTSTCTENQVEAVINGTATVKDWILVDENTKGLFNGSSGTSSAPSASASKKGGASSVRVEMVMSALFVGLAAGVIALM
jgi:hypothetical protein